ncbi:uncharacterized protein LOC128349904 isoform X3 [Hemicordylus capensis]|uniref:uncharacterized protein LOC128349904 isoform X3 n=1 Tax=Hemicordylus capensis TaxID=884348 RepID=UPI0023020AAF|nr:uncharacterized protein LOC128349904 isoform X3 [Hemicordylus capensis]
MAVQFLFEHLQQRRAHEAASFLGQLHSFKLLPVRGFSVGKSTPSSDSKVILTNMKIINSEMNQSQGQSRENLAATDSSEETQPPESGTLIEPQANLVIGRDSPVEAEQLATLPCLNTLTSKCHLPRLAKYESEDSGVELPSGANSPLTPKGSEKSFVLHSRDSSCDSGMLSVSSSPTAGHVVMIMCKDTVDICPRISDSKKPEEHYEGQADAIQTSAASLEDVTDCPEGNNSDQSCSGSTQGECLEDKPSKGTNTFLLPATPVGDERYSDDYSKHHLQESPLQGHPLRKYPTSDSLDEYMDECCRLSEVNQGNAKAFGSGLGYLEHICQLIEKIGQLQDHNLRLQKQVGNLQKEQKTIQLKEEYFLQHCSCGAASILFSSYQEMKRLFAGKSRPHSLLVQNGNMSDLSIIPEMGRSSGKSSDYRDVHMDSENNQLIMGSKFSNGRKNGENECREDCNGIDGQAFLPKELAMKRSEYHAWGRMRDLVRKTRGRNQSRLGLSSTALKRSCPQLYSSPEIQDANNSRRDKYPQQSMGCISFTNATTTTSTTLHSHLGHPVEGKGHGYCANTEGPLHLCFYDPAIVTQRNILGIQALLVCNTYYKFCSCP